MHGIEAQAIAVIVLQPHQRVVDEEAPHLIAAFLVEVDGVSPGCLAVWIEIRAEFGGVVTDRPEVVVDHIQNNAQAGCVTGIDKALEAVRTSVGLVRREQGDAVVTPALLTCPGSHRHDLNMRHPQVGKVLQVLDRAIERAFLAEGADMQLIDDGADLRGASPELIVPLEAGCDRRVRKGHARHPADANRAGPDRA